MMMMMKNDEHEDKEEEEEADKRGHPFQSPYDSSPDHDHLPEIAYD